MSSEFTLDPVSGIPDPPTDESMILEWAKELTKSLQKDHVASVDRAETQVMMGYGVDDRPESTGSRRFHYDSISGTLTLDAEQTPELSEWVNINNVPTYQPDGLGVNVMLTTLPYATPGLNGYISWEEELWDENSYWTIGSPTEITFNTSGRYAVRFELTLTGLASGGGFLSEINGNISTNADEVYMITSAGAGETYDVVISYQREFVEDDVLKFYWDISDTCSITACTCVVTPYTSTTGSIGVQPNPEHGGLVGLADDDHLQYLLASDATDRTTFATNWTDLTDGGSTSLHFHSPLYLNNDEYIHWRNNADNDWLDVIKVDSNDDFLFGIFGGAHDTYIHGQDVFVAPGATFDVDAASDINLDSAGTVNIISSGGWIYLDGETRIKNNNDFLWGRISSSADYYKLIGLSSDNRVEVGDTSRNTWIHGSSILRLGDFACPIYLEDSASGTWVDSIGYESYAHNSATVNSLGLGNTARGMVLKGTYMTIDASQEIYLESVTSIYLKTTGANADIALDSGDKIYLTGADDVVLTTPMVDASSGGKVRLPYSDAGGHANGDIWMESDGLHIYRSGAEYIVDDTAA